MPVLDSLITALSLVAQFMMTRKWIENWPVWILANCISVGLLTYKGLYVTSALYLVYQVLCIMGWKEWRAALRPNEAVPRVEDKTTTLAEKRRGGAEGR